MAHPWKNIPVPWKMGLWGCQDSLRLFPDSMNIPDLSSIPQFFPYSRGTLRSCGMVEDVQAVGLGSEADPKDLCSSSQISFKDLWKSPDPVLSRIDPTGLFLGFPGSCVSQGNWDHPSEEL